jgi:hypothetical protein
MNRGSKSYINLPETSVFRDLNNSQKRRAKLLKVAETIFETPDKPYGSPMEDSPARQGKVEN